MNSVAIKDSGSNYNFGDKRIWSKVKKSAFDLSYINNMTADEGILYPVMTKMTLPNSDYDIDVTAIIKAVQSPKVPLATRIRVFFHTYWCSMDMLWADWQVFTSKGRSRSVNKITPNFHIAYTSDSHSSSYTFNTKNMYLLDLLGLPQGTWYGDNLNNVHYTPFKVMMYAQVYKWYYKHVASDVNNSIFFPDVEEEFRLKGNYVSTDGPSVFISGSSNEKLEFNLALASGKTMWFANYDNTSSRGNNAINSDVELTTGGLYHRNFVDDYFTSAIPYEMFGDIPTLDIKINTPLNADVGNVTYDNMPLQLTFKDDWTSSGLDVFEIGTADTDGTYKAELYSIDNGDNPGSASSRVVDKKRTETSYNPSPKQLKIRFNDSIVGTSITRNQLLGLYADTQMLDKMATTDGSYGQFVQTFFSEYPDSAKSYKPKYVGGTYAPITFTEVLQTSASSGTDTLGSTAGHVLSACNGKIGRFHSDDFGILMTIMSIMPDTYYSQGVRKEDTIVSQDDLYLPERSLLGNQPILNKEIYPFGYDEPGAGTHKGPNELFAWQSRCDDLRYSQNETHGLVSDMTDGNIFKDYTESRVFEDTPAYNKYFMSTKGNIRSDWKTVPSDPAFFVQLRNGIKAILPLSYKSHPKELI